MWAKEFDKVFDLNDALVAIGYDSVPNATLAEAIEIMKLLFGPSIIDYQLGIYTATRDDAAYEAWIDRLVAHDVIKVGDSLEYSKPAVEAQIALGTYSYQQEIYRIMDLMQDLTPFVNAQGKFQLDILYASTDILGRKDMTNLDSIFKSRDITNKGRLVKAMVFPVVMYGCENWTIKKAEHQKLMLLNCGVGEDS